MVPGPLEEPHHIVCHLGEIMAKRGITLVDLSERVGISVVNLSVLKNNRAKAVRFETLARLCAVLECKPGELLDYLPPR